MAKIVKLAQFLPEDITFELPGGDRFVAPGDPPLDLILKIAELFERSEQAGDEDETDGVGLDILRELDAEVLKLLRMRDSMIESSPFGVIGVQHFVATLLQAYNFGQVEEEGDPPTKPAVKKKSRPPSGSRSS
jgi:hypothetical protein